MFVLDGNEGAKQAQGRGGIFSDPIVIGGDDGEEGEIRSPAQTPPPPEEDDDSRSESKHKKKHSSKKKRKRSKSPSHSPKHKKRKHRKSPSPSPPPVRRERNQQQQFAVTGVNYQNNNQRSRGYDQRPGSSSSSRSGGYDMGRNFNDSRKNASDSDRRYGNHDYNTSYGRQYPYVESVPSRTNAQEYESRQTNYDGRKQNQPAISGERRSYYEEQRYFLNAYSFLINGSFCLS